MSSRRLIAAPSRELRRSGSARARGARAVSSGRRPGLVALGSALAFTLALSLACVVVTAAPATAVVIKLGDGSGHTTPPADDPGMANVGTINAFSGVYVGNKWVLTANHVGQAPIVLGGVSYADVPASTHRLTTPGVGLADLRLFKLQQDPGLPAMNISVTEPWLDTTVVMLGNGRDRGGAVSWGGADGWQTLATRTLRWGRNRVAAINQTALDTAIYYTQFDENGGLAFDDEAQSVIGDSGGAAFYKRGGVWELSGIMFANALNAPDQPTNYVLYGNQSLIADLSVYRDEILNVITAPTCSDGVDDDGDTLVDYPDDPGCASANDDDERDAGLVCDDGLDEDGDGLVDWPADPGCGDSLDTSEQSPSLLCDDGIDNDADGLIDHPQDPECNGSPTAPIEGPPPAIPVSSGLGSSLLAVLLGWLGGAQAGERGA